MKKKILSAVQRDLNLATDFAEFGLLSRSARSDHLKDIRCPLGSRVAMCGASVWMFEETKKTLAFFGKPHEVVF